MDILINNAYENDLKNIDVIIPTGKVIGVSGVSGSGKSTLVKDIIAACGAQNYALALPMIERGLIANNSIVKVGSVENLPATLMIDVVNSVNKPNSTLSTITRIHTILRELYFKFREYICPNCGSEISKDPFDILPSILHSVFAEIKCDANYNDKVNSIKNNFSIIKTEYFDSEDNPQKKRSQMAI